MAARVTFKFPYLSSSILTAPLRLYKYVAPNFFGVFTFPVQNLRIEILPQVNNLNVEISLPSEVVLPGTQAEFTVSLFDPETGTPQAGEVAVFIVDKVTPVT
jgi:hypothetical protein